ncbi:MAG: MotE family protein [Verrucomicrobiota bacterium]
MNKVASNPAIIAVLGLLSGTLVGLGWFWRAGEVLLAQAIASIPPPVVAEGKAQGWDFWTIEIEGLSSELKEERARLRAQADSLNQRAARLASEQQELAKIRADIEAMRAEIGRKVIEITADEAKNLKSLAATYSNLTPAAAVAILREMDDTTVVKILSLMKSDMVGPIFEEMAATAGPEGTLAKRAAILSEKLRLMKAAKSAT